MEPEDRPVVTVKYAQTLDGRIATATGDSKWISGEEARRFGHRLRSENDAVLVGIGTVVADDPQLTTRLVEGPSPIRVVLDSWLRIPPDSHVFKPQASQVILVTKFDAPPDRLRLFRERGVAILQVESGEFGLDMPALLRLLYGRGVRSTLVEGGSAIITSMFRERLVDRLVALLAAKVVGAGVEAIADLGIHHLREAVSFRDYAIEPLGRDFVFTGIPVWPSE